MNKKFSGTSLILFTLMLTACASITKTTGAASSGRASTVELPKQTKLVLGAINLEETDYVITAEQATQLLPMFYVLQDLNESNSAAQEEMDGLVNQIQETLTAEQVQAIDGMSLSMRDVFALTQGSSSQPNSSGASSATGAGGGGTGGQPEMGGGGMPGGSGPSGGGMGGGDPSGMPGGMTSTGNTSANSGTSARPVTDTSTPSALFDAVIEILEKKIQ